MLQTSPDNERLQAALIIARWLESGSFPDRLMEAREEYRPLVRELVLGVLRWRRSLRWLMDRAVSRYPGRELEAVLLTGLYQVLFLDREPDYAVVNETVWSARKLTNRHAAGMVNAVLRKAARERQKWLRDLKKAPPAVKWSHPDVLWRRWRKQYGESQTIRLFRWNNRRAATVVRVNMESIDPAELLSRWQAAAVPARFHPAGKSFLILGRGAPALQRLEGYREGWFYARDPATDTAVALLDPRPGENVLDACAAPGGKTVEIARRIGPSGRLTATDLHDDRLQLLKHNLRRMRLSTAELLQVDISRPNSALLARAPFDAILLDVPCSNTGVIRRRPDTRWRFSNRRLSALAATQRRILEGSRLLLRPGGRLVYSTCSLEKEENEMQIAEFTTSKPGVRLSAERFIFPPDNATDGAYAACLTVNRP